jgi:hypothetical protein
MRMTTTGDERMSGASDPGAPYRADSVCGEGASRDFVHA